MKKVFYTAIAVFILLSGVAFAAGKKEVVPNNADSNDIVPNEAVASEVVPNEADSNSADSNNANSNNAASKEPVELHMYADAELRAPAEKIIKSFEDATGDTVTVEWAGMEQLISRYKKTGVGDVILSSDESYMDALKKDAKVDRSEDLAYNTAVMAIRKNKAANIKSFADLAKSNLTIAMGNYKTLALGKIAQVMLEKSGYGSLLRGKVMRNANTVPELVRYVLKGEVDAAIIDRTDAIKNANSLVILPTPDGVPQEISVISSLTTSEHPDAAAALVEWFAKPENIQLFVDAGYLPMKGKV